jgi:nucleoside-diphosphate-sugar epimerase
MRILITGGAGYLGSVLTPRLLDEGMQVTVLDNLMYGQRSLLACCGRPGFAFVRGDVRDETLLRGLLAQVDAVIPLAAIVGAPACDRDPWTSTDINLGAVQLLERLRSPDQLVIFPTTNSGYGTQTGELHCTEDTPLQPISRYGRDKAEAEALLLGGDAVTFRLATVFGVSPRLRLDLMVNHFTHTAWDQGYIVLFEEHFQRNFVHVRDVAEAFLFALRHQDAMRGRCFNLGLDAANMSKLQLAMKIKEQVPGFEISCSELGTDPDKRNYVVSNQRLREAGFEARVGIDQGIRELLMAFPMLPRSPFSNV